MDVYIVIVVGMPVNPPQDVFHLDQVFLITREATISRAWFISLVDAFVRWAMMGCYKESFVSVIDQCLFQPRDVFSV